MTSALARAAILLFVLSCGDGAVEPAPPPPAPVATTVTVSPASATLTAFEETARFTAEVRDQNGQVMVGAAVAWASSNAEVAVVDASGLLTAMANGNATITAVSGSASGSASVTVAQEVGAVAVTPPGDTLIAGDTVRLTAEAADANGHPVAGTEFDWSSSDTLVAVVDDGGLVIGVGVGEAEVTARAAGVTGRATLTVVAPAPTTVAVTPDTVALTALGQTAQMAAEVRDQLERTMQGVPVSWSSADTTVAYVDSAGLVTAAGSGATTVSALAGEVSGEAVVTVMQLASSVVVTPASDTVTLGDTLRLAAEAFDENGHAVAGTDFNWSSSNVSIAGVDDSGLVTGNGEGLATIKATVGDAHGTSDVTVENPDRAALVAFYEAADGPNWINSENWLTDAPLGDWYGVHTDGLGRVVELDLAGEWDRDKREWVSRGLSGPIPPELANLTQLRRLELYENALEGPIPPELGTLVNLEDLSLGGNNLVGAIPSELANLAELRDLSLNGNALEGAIPPELGNLVNLAWLRLDGNNLDGRIPSELANLTQLRTLNLYGNALEGSIPPELGSLVNLEWLPLGRNNLVGPIPSELANLTQLRTLNLYGNALEGPIPAEFGSLVNLEWLSLGANRLEGPIPESLLQLDRLRGFYIGSNEGLCVPGTSAFVAWLEGIERKDESGTLCNESDWKVLESLFERAGGSHWTHADGWVGGPALDGWHGVRADSLGRVMALDLEGNGLAGRLPASLGSLAQMTELRIGGNTALSGPLPLSLAALSLRALHYEGTSVCAPSQAGFREWLKAIPSHEGTGASCAPLTDREILEAVYETLRGPGWTNSDNWLTGRPLRHWYGVEVDRQGRVIGLSLAYNGISGWIPPEIGSLRHLEWLDIGGFSGLAGAIPAELGNLTNLRVLILFDTDLAGTIPAELGNLANLELLILDGNNLEGAIPAELGDLAKLAELILDGNNLEGAIPAELGSLTDLQRMSLSNNELTGPIPAQLSNLSHLQTLSLDRNGLVGSLPAELSGLVELEELHVGYNSLSGTVPVEFQRLARLREFSLQGNADMSGALPAELAALDSLETLVADGTGLCAPSDAAFLNWLDDLPNGRIPLCGSSPAMAYLVQTVQSREFPVPLVAGEEALLRTFVTASRADQESPLPPVRASFHVGDARVHVAEVPASAGPIPTVVEQGSLAASVNAVIPADVIRPGLEMFIEVDPDGTLDPGLGVTRRIPETGSLPVDVREMPILDLTVIPFLWSADPDSAILEHTAGMAADPHGHELLSDTRTLLPVGGIEITAHEPVLTTSNNMFDLHRETGAIRMLESGSGHWMGMMSGPVTGAGGVGFLPGRVTSAVPASAVIAHELGHNMYLSHAPCGEAGGPDPAFPYRDGSSGVWGYDFGHGRLVRPSRPDLMSYCGPEWVSDYHFTKALHFRLADEGSGSPAMVPESAASLMLWGGVDADEAPFLEPAFAVDAPPMLPDSAGDYRLIGTSSGGETLFSISFTMAVLADADGASSFAFVMPVLTSWQTALAEITLTGPAGTTAVNSESNRPMAILRDPRTGHVRGILRDPLPQYQVAADGVWGVAGPGLDILFSRGIPDAAAWTR